LPQPNLLTAEQQVEKVIETKMISKTQRLLRELYTNKRLASKIIASDDTHLEF
jgi:hypothetical protein